MMPALTVVYLCLPVILFFWGWVRLRVSLIALFFLLSVVLVAGWEALRAAKHEAAEAKGRLAGDPADLPPGADPDRTLGKHLGRGRYGSPNDGPGQKHCPFERPDPAGLASEAKF